MICIIKTILLAMSLWFLCSTNTVMAKSNNETRILFDCYYINFAWGFTLKGYYIDSNGAVFSYDHSHKMWNPESVEKGLNVYTEKELLAKYTNKKTLFNLETSKVSQYHMLLDQVLKGNISRKANANDMGSMGCVGYIYNERNNSYKEVILGSSGDFIISNSANEAAIVNNWLNGISSKINKTKAKDAN